MSISHGWYQFASALSRRVQLSYNASTRASQEVNVAHLAMKRTRWSATCSIAWLILKSGEMWYSLGINTSMQGLTPLTARGTFLHRHWQIASIWPKSFQCWVLHQQHFRKDMSRLVRSPISITSYCLSSADFTFFSFWIPCLNSPMPEQPHAWQYNFALGSETFSFGWDMYLLASDLAIVMTESLGMNIT